ncbi:unnamed protein product [Phytophthora fragariaefolia]|uniref:Unnamed protein product n=1 Tax=Phytophthora fragariaefolia TaxID=1490495 RepID=A0A9W6YAY3_9STRA|nr:unnamed protein product [Phytophthora fragariaefolia]
MIKHRCTTRVTIGRDVAVDEASIACRSQFARHIIVFKPRKPTGKYHFKLYVCCCSTSWYVISFKLHCASDLESRLEGVLPRSEITSIAELTKESSGVRSHVIAVTASMKGTLRVVNTDNFYTSCLLLESLRSIGLYCRGTVRQTSQLFPKYTMIEAKHDTDRGQMKQGVSVEKHIVVASWVKGAVVNIVSNADSSDISTVFRRIGQEKVAFQALTCIKNYNAAMQGVDRHDQLRGRFSIANGHSFKKWHKKLARAMVDIARCNAYVCHELCCGRTPGCEVNSIFDETKTRPEHRDHHRSFVAALVRELFDGSWIQWLESDNGLIYMSNETAQPPHQNSEHSHRDANCSATSVLPQCIAK